MWHTSVRTYNSIRINHYLISTLMLLLSGPAWTGSLHYGYGSNPDDAMSAAIEAARRESQAGCLGRSWKPDIDRDCKFAGRLRSFFDEKGNDLGAYECVAEGSNHSSSCR